MPWARFDDRSNDDAKLIALSSDAFRLWVRGNIYCQKNLTDGFISELQVRQLAGWLKDKAREAVLVELCATLVIGKGPLWHKVDGGYQVHDYLDWNDPRDKVLAERKRAEDRQARFHERKRFKRVAHAVHNAVHNALKDASQNGVDNPVENGGSTYHVPQDQVVPPEVLEPKEQERCAPISQKSDTDRETAKQAEKAGLTRMLRRRRSRETDTGEPATRVISALARDVLAAHPDEHDDGELKEHLKAACARVNLDYDATSCGQALDIARAQLRKRNGASA